METINLDNVNAFITKDTITKEQERRIQSGGYAQDGNYYTIKEFTAEYPDGSFYAGVASYEHAQDVLFMARYFHPGNEYRVVEIKAI